LKDEHKKATIPSGELALRQHFGDRGDILDKF